MNWPLFIAIVAIVVPSSIVVAKAINKFSSRLTILEEKQRFLETYLLKNAVLEFHSPDPKHAETDKIIEKLIAEKRMAVGELEPEEIDKLVFRIKRAAIKSDDPKEKLRAVSTLQLMAEFVEGVGPVTNNALDELEGAFR